MKCPVAGDFAPEERLKAEWAAAFARWGLVPGTTPLDAAAAKVNESPIRDRVLTTLDEWLVRFGPEVLAAILRAADADEFRDAVRSAIVAREYDRVAELARGPLALDQPPRFATVLGGNACGPD